jgi:protein-tyrosine phosphatase
VAFREHLQQTSHRLGLSILLNLLRQGERVLVHCEMGLNRSALLAGLILVHGGVAGEVALERLQVRRPGALLNLRFSDYLRQQPRGGQPLDLG